MISTSAYSNHFNLIDSTQFNKISSKIDYTKNTKKVISIKEFKRKSPEQEEISQPKINGIRSISDFINVLAYIMIIALVGTILYFLFINIESPDSKIMYEEKFTEEEDIDDIDAHSLYLEALDKKDYRTAIRMRFILVLQKYSAEQLIDWKLEKTNRDYKKELRNTRHFQFFSSASNIYDRIWYGNSEINQEEFQYLNPYFELKPESIDD